LALTPDARQGFRRSRTGTQQEHKQTSGPPDTR
jgi:hypothetical protein